MKRYIITLCLLIPFFLCVSFTDSLDNICNEVNKGIRNGNVQQLSKYFSSTVELSVLGKGGYVSKSQTTFILTDFFKENPPKSYEVKQGGSNSENTKFVIGTYISTSGGNFKIYYVVKKEKEVESIHKLTIEKK